jgi:lipopolysaccharide/colanic/teichoic acid biosynthesis glycosyltransferase
MGMQVKQSDLDTGSSIQHRSSPANSRLKRCIDLAITIPLAVLALPLILIVACLILVTMGRPVFFVQERPGFKCKPFRLVKFRSMKTARAGTVAHHTDAQRLTTLGRVIRRTSLDEIPELWNILRGDMSLVGPRPLLMEYVPYFTDRERARFGVRPGLTGWAQVNGRNHATWDQRLNDDVWYVENWSHWLDIRILWRTLRMVLKRQDVVEDARSIMLNLDEERSR